MSPILNLLYDNYVYLNYELADPRFSPWLFHNVLFIPLLLSCYYLFVTNQGPRMMMNKQPYDLTNVLIAHNAVKTLVNAYIVFYIVTYIFPTFSCWTLCKECDMGDLDFNGKLEKLIKIIFVERILDLLDTVYMVLRKKTNQVSFLHVYHHSMVVGIGWLVMKYGYCENTGCHVILVMLINSIVHTLMYFYYMLTTIYPAHKMLILIKPRVTEMQIIQLVFLTCHSLTVNIYCPNMSPSLLRFYLINEIIMLSLFFNFYYKSYIRPQKQKTN